MKRFLFFALIISPFLFSQCDFIKTKILGQESPADTMAAYQARLDSIRKADSIKAAKARQDSIERMDSIQQAKKQAKKDSIARADSIRKAKRNRNKYHIISGSFKTPKYAENYKKRMKNHYKYSGTKILQANNGFNLVSIESYPTYSKALNRLRSIRNEKHFQVWVYKAN